MLTMLKTDLGIRTSTAYDARLEQLLTVAQREIIAEGASDLDASDALDQQLIVMYAAWLYRKRVTGEGRPPMLQIIINDRKVAKATGADA